MNKPNTNSPEAEKCLTYSGKSFYTIMSIYVLGIISPFIILFTFNLGENYFIIAYLMTILVFGVLIISIIVFTLIGIFHGIQSIRKNEEDYQKNIWGIFSNLFFILLAALTVYGSFFLKGIFTK